MVSTVVEPDGMVRVALQPTEVAAAELVQQQLSRAYSSSGSLGAAVHTD